MNYCDRNYLELIVSKTKEIIIDYRRNRREPDPILLKGSEVERVVRNKYLGVVIDKDLKWNGHVDFIVRLNSRIRCLSKLYSFKVNTKILSTSYNSIVASVWCCCLIYRGGNVEQGDEDRIDRIVMAA